jgi:trehalose/maltose transport system substrate-binding protein
MLIGAAGRRGGRFGISNRASVAVGKGATMIQRFVVRVFALALLLAGAGTASSARAETVAVACGAVGNELKVCTELAQAWAKHTGNTVRIVPTPNSTTERLALYQQLLAAGSSDVDVFEIDVIWPGILGSYFIDLAPYSKGVEKNYFPVVINNDTRDGKLLAMPIYLDAGLLFYRKDLLAKYGLQPPQTWDELAADARKVQDSERSSGDAGMQGFVFQAKAYEGLTCNALEWVASFKGGSLIDGSGKVTIDNPNAVKALETAASWMKSIAPQGVLNYSEEESRGVFQSGHAVFMRNWPYAYPLAESADSPVKGKVGVLPIPKGGADGDHSSALGGWQMAVSKYSKHQALAADLALFLTSQSSQKIWATEGGYFPAIPALYKDPDVLKANPLFSIMFPSFDTAVARPSTVTDGAYNEVSNQFWNAVHDVLAGQSNATDALKSLSRQLHRMSHGGHW